MLDLCAETIADAPYRVDETNDAVVIRNKFGLSVVSMSRMPTMPKPQCADSWQAVLSFCYDCVAIINDLAEKSVGEGAE